MINILWHGRGGQGAFTAAKILGAAYVLSGDDRYALAFPSFGPERRGAPIRAFTKLSDKPVGDRSEIKKADYIIYLDDTLYSDSDLSDLKDGGKVIINTKKTFDDDRFVTLDGSRIAEEILHMPITNTIMLGAFAVVSSALSLESIEDAIRQNMAAKLHEKNIKAVKAAAKAAGETTGEEVDNEAVS